MSLFAFHSRFARWTYLIGSVRLHFPGFHLSTAPSIKFLHNRCNLNAQLLIYLSSLVSSGNFQNGSKIVKKLKVTKSIEEVLLLTSSQDSLLPSEVSASLHVLVQHKYSSLSSTCWSYYNSQKEMWIQTNINSDIKSGFMPLLNSPDFCQLCRHLWNLLPQLSNTELLTCLHSLLRLHFPADNELSVHLQHFCLQKSHQFDLPELALYSSIANMLQRNGFVVYSLICSRFQEIMMTDELSTENFHDFANVLYNSGYFLSSKFIEVIMLKLSDFIKDSNKEIETLLLVYCLEAIIRHSEKINSELLEQLYHHFYEAIETMGIHDLRKIVSILGIYGYLREDFKKLSTERALNILSRGFLRASDVVSLINVFDACGWTQNAIKEMEDLVLLHVHEFDVLALKHASSSKFMSVCQNSSIRNEFSERITRKLSDISNSLSCLLSVTKFYSRVYYRNSAFHFRLRNLLLEQIHTEQRVFHPSHLRVFYEYFLNTTKNVSSVVTNGITDLFHQFTFKDIIGIARSLNKMNFQQMSVSEECLIGNLKDTLRKNIFQRQNEICDLKQLVMLDRCSLTKYYAENDTTFLSKLYDRLAPSVNLQTLKIACTQLSKHMLYVPTTLQYLCDFACTNGEKLHLDSLLCLLETCAFVNFLPKNFIDLQEVCFSRFRNFNDSLSSDNDHALASYLINFAHSCALLGHFPSQVMKLIFTVEFIKSFDELCTEHQFKKELLLEKLLELNTCVVLECPHLSIPWFHENIQNFRELHYHPKYNYWKDIVSDGLMEALEGTEYLKTSKILCPYHYNIDIECYLTSDGLPTTYRDVDKKVYTDIRRVAVIILQPHHICSNSTHLLGTTEMKIRHLEILGYKVVRIPYMELNPSNLTNEAKCTYFKQKLCLGR